MTLHTGPLASTFQELGLQAHCMIPCFICVSISKAQLPGLRRWLTWQNACPASLDTQVHCTAQHSFKKLGMVAHADYPSAGKVETDVPGPTSQQTWPT